MSVSESLGVINLSSVLNSEEREKKPETTTEFDSSIFVRYLFESTIACTLIFAFGELIEQTSQTRKHVEDMQRTINEKMAHDILEDK